MKAERQGYDLLNDTRLLAGLTQTDRTQLGARFSERHWPKGLVFPASWGTEGFHVISEGRIELIRSNIQTGRGFTVSLLGPGDVFDLISLASESEHHVTPVAIDSVRVYSVDLSEARQWLRTVPAFARSIVAEMARQVVELEDVATDLAVHNTSTRLARLLVRYGVESSVLGRSSLLQDLPHEALARMVGSVRVVVNRHVQDLKRSGAIKSHRRWLEVTDSEALLTHCEGLEAATSDW